MTRIIETLTAEERSAMVACSRSLVGTPFRHTGRTERGIDCVGLVAYALASVGRSVADRRNYGRNPVRDGLRQVLVDHFGDPVPLDQMQSGDVVLMRWHRHQGIDLFNHVGIVGDYPLGGFSLIHALAEVKSVVEHRLADPWPRRIVEVFRP